MFLGGMVCEQLKHIGDLTMWSLKKKQKNIGSVKPNHKTKRNYIICVDQKVGENNYNLKFKLHNFVILWF